MNSKHNPILKRNYRTHGKPPYHVALIHGGPGALGEMALLARVLQAKISVLEPLQTETSLKGQVEELRSLLEAQAELPVTLVGFSWGAWLSYILTAGHLGLVKKLILVGSGPFEHHYAAQIHKTRLSRMTRDEAQEFENIIQELNDPGLKLSPDTYQRLGSLASKADQYDPLEVEQDDLDESRRSMGNRFFGVLGEAQAMRKDGRLLALGRKITIPVTAIHGVYDPHPAAGVFEPLGRYLADFRFIPVENCGHKPWIEKGAKDEFMSILQAELLDV